MTLSRRMKQERRMKSVKTCAEFVASAVAVAIMVAMIYYGMWAGCALSDVCFNANI